jgi:hypothetical protein
MLELGLHQQSWVEGLLLINLIELLWFCQLGFQVKPSIHRSSKQLLPCRISSRPRGPKPRNAMVVEMYGPRCETMTRSVMALRFMNGGGLRMLHATGIYDFYMILKLILETWNKPLIISIYTGQSYTYIQYIYSLFCAAKRNGVKQGAATHQAGREWQSTADFSIKYHQITKYVANVLFSLLSPQSLIPFDALTCSGAVLLCLLCCYGTEPVSQVMVTFVCDTTVWWPLLA